MAFTNCFILLVIYVSACAANPAVCPLPVNILVVKDPRQVQQEMLRLFNLEQRPPKARIAKIKHSTKFMMDLYKVVNCDDAVSNRLEKRSLEVPLRWDEVAKAEVSDIVLSMNPVNSKPDDVGQKQKLAFSMNGVPSSAKLVSAELKLYQDQKMAVNLPYNMHVISVYKPLQFTAKYVQMKKMAEKITSIDFTGWMSINITNIVDRWLQYPTEIQEIYVSVKPLMKDESKEIHPESIGIVFEKSENEPFVVGFLKANNTITSRRTRNVNPTSYRIDLIDLLANRDKCGMYTLRVSFKDLGWNDWVIAPEGYTTAFCQGVCNFPLKYPMEATPHAIVQSLMHAKHPKKFPKPACGPAEASHLSVLYKERDNTILKHYKQMIVRSCSCQ